VEEKDLAWWATLRTLVLGLVLGTIKGRILGEDRGRRQYTKNGGGESKSFPLSRSDQGGDYAEVISAAKIGAVRSAQQSRIEQVRDKRRQEETGRRGICYYYYCY
jgi:hypothetical protein